MSIFKYSAGEIQEIYEIGNEQFINKQMYKLVGKVNEAFDLFKESANNGEVSSIIVVDTFDFTELVINKVIDFLNAEGFNAKFNCYQTDSRTEIIIKVRA